MSHSLMSRGLYVFAYICIKFLYLLCRWLYIYIHLFVKTQSLIMINTKNRLGASLKSINVEMTSGRCSYFLSFCWDWNLNTRYNSNFSLHVLGKNKNKSKNMSWTKSVVKRRRLCKWILSQQNIEYVDVLNKYSF